MEPAGKGKKLSKKKERSEPDEEDAEEFVETVVEGIVFRASVRAPRLGGEEATGCCGDGGRTRPPGQRQGRPCEATHDRYQPTPPRDHQEGSQKLSSVGMHQVYL